MVKGLYQTPLVPDASEVLRSFVRLPIGEARTSVGGARSGSGTWVIFWDIAPLPVVDTV